MGSGDASGPSRRSLLRGGLAAGAGVGVAAAAGGFAGHALAGTGSTQNETEPFYGANQSGILTDTQRQVVLASFDLTTSDKNDLATLLKDWTELGAALTAGQSVTVPIYDPPGAAGADAYADATGGSTTDDSLEAYQLGANRLTLTIGVGRSLFVTPAGADRFGLSGQLPPALIELPRFSGDELTAADSDGDLFLQACADDPQVAFHAVRSIARIAPDIATLRWTQVGFSPDNTGGTPRNLRLASPQANGGAVILRRAFSYNNGTTQFTERWPPWRQALEYDAGLLFLGYQQDPRQAFVPVFTRLSAADALNQFTTHTASAVFAVLPGATGPGDWVGRTLLG